MNGPFLNTTASYHRQELDSLHWEMTLSLMLEDPGSPCRDILEKADSFGNLLYNFLAEILPMDSIHSLMEIGGGYGHIARDFLKRDSKLRATMIDISPFLLEQQRQMLKGSNAAFIQIDFFEIDESLLSGIDLALLNEAMGDFPTACDIPRRALYEVPAPEDRLLREVKSTCDRYGIMPSVSESFTLNLGAIKALEKLCTARIPYIYISEHSCEAGVPDELRGLMELHPGGDPERIRLHGHDEYTIRFSDLEKVASSYGYSSLRGQYIDFIEPVIDGEVSFVLCLGSSKIDRYEIIKQFIEDLVKYEYLILSL